MRADGDSGPETDSDQIENALLDVRHIRRKFDSVLAVDDVSFSLRAGQVLGFIGANGAGKTTTLRMIAMLEVPDRGSVFLHGNDLAKKGKNFKRELGWMPDAYGTYDNMTVYEYLDFFARAYGYSGPSRAKRVREVMEFTDLTGLRNRFIDSLSKGMGQRLCLGRTLIHDPSVLLLDEPAAGLDPKARIDFKHLVRLLAEDGKGVIISSHILSELEDMCDSLLFIDKGRIIHHGQAEELRRGKESEILLEIRAAGELERLEQFLSLQPGVELLESIKNGFCVRLEGEISHEAQHALLQGAIAAGHQVYGFNERTRRLEDAFVEILGGNGG